MYKTYMQDGSDKLFIVIMQRLNYENVHYFNSGGQSITWYEPPPVETVTDAQLVHTNNIQLYTGSINKSLNWTFSLAQDPIVISLRLNGSGVASIVTSTASVLVAPAFTSRVYVTWVTGQVTMIIFNVTAADEGVFSCQLTTVSANVWKRNIKVAVVGNYKVIVLYCSLSNTCIHEVAHYFFLVVNSKLK